MPKFAGKILHVAILTSVLVGIVPFMPFHENTSPARMVGYMVLICIVMKRSSAWISPVVLSIATSWALFYHGIISAPTDAAVFLVLCLSATLLASYAKLLGLKKTA